MKDKNYYLIFSLHNLKIRINHLTAHKYWIKSSLRTQIKRFFDKDPIRMQCYFEFSFNINL